ncbi:MAG TPA: PA14 domain-containing protein, partial [Vicinamibacterales bacterium]|nr:PA14 domain-containing protein [Vicinamibacterales bacterium]
MRVTRAAVAAAVLTGILFLFAATQAVDPLREGLRATYFSDTAWSSTPAVAVVQPRPSTAAIDRAWQSRPPGSFSATWTGSLCVLIPGSYTFFTRSDDGSWLYIDGVLVVDNGGGHAAKTAHGSVTLDRGVHEIFVKYFQETGDYELELQWARNGGEPQAIPEWALSVRSVEFRRALASVAVRWLVDVSVLLWPFGLIAIGSAAMWPGLRARAAARLTDPAVLALAAVVAASLALNAVGLWWGVPQGWAGDEIDPDTLLSGLARSFAHGWYHRYPPAMFYALSLVYSPWLLLRSFGWFAVASATDKTILFVLGRLVSVAAGAGTLVALYACTARTLGKRPGVGAAAAMATLTTFVFYAKFANPELPYLFWFAVSLACLARFMDTLKTLDLACFGAAAAFAVASKDQAYGLYVAAPFLLVYRLWRDHRAAGRPRPLVRAIVDRRLVVGAVSAALVFAALYLVPFNSEGLAAHMRDIMGVGSQGYREFEPGIAGEAGMLALTARLDVQAWGWPLVAASCAGFAIVVSERRTRFAAAWLAILAAAYYAAFLCVILYNYDRYLLPIIAVQAMFAGAALDRLVRWRPARRPVGAMLAAAALVYTLLYAGTIDILMLRDARYAAEAWLRAHGRPKQTVGAVFPEAVLPRLDAYVREDISDPEALAREAPAFFVLNADYARAVLTLDPSRRLADFIRRLQGQSLGYRLVFRYRAPDPFPWLPDGHPDLVGP